MNSKIEITKVDNGFIIRMDNDNHYSKIFTTLKDLINFLENYWPEKIR